MDEKKLEKRIEKVLIQFGMEIDNDYVKASDCALNTIMEIIYEDVYIDVSCDTPNCGDDRQLHCFNCEPYPN